MDNFELVTNQPEVGFADVHPTPSARKDCRIKGTDLPPHQGVDGLESKFVRCRQCGFILDSTKTTRGSGYGNENLQPISGSDLVEPAEAGAGCPFCFSSEW